MRTLNIAGAKFHIESFLLSSQGPTPDVYARSTVVNTNNEIMGRLDRDTQGGTNVSPTTVNAASSMMVGLSGESRNVRIAGGFGSERFTFILIVSPIGGGIQSNQRTAILGHTDHCNVATQGNHFHLDPNMLLFINSTYTLSSRSQMNQNGVVGMNTTKQANFRILNPDDDGAGNINSRSSMFKMTPSNICTASHELENERTSDSGENWHRNPSAHVVRAETKVVDRGASYGNRVFSDVINSYSSGKAISMNANEYGDGLYKGLGDEYHSALDPHSSTAWSEGSLIASTRDPALNLKQTNILSELQRHHTYAECGFITVEDLSRVVGDLSAAAELPNVRANVNKQWNAGNLAGLDITAIAANHIAEIVPTAMLDQSLGYVSVSLSNVTGVPEATIIPATPNQLPYAGISGVSVGQVELNAFISLLLVHLHPKLLNIQGGDRVYSAHIEASLLGELVVSVCYHDTGETLPKIYPFPCYCDSLYTAIVTNNSNDLYDMATTMKTITEDVISGATHAGNAVVGGHGGATQYGPATQPVAQATQYGAPAQHTLYK